jgi:hypothetical protein
MRHVQSGCMRLEVIVNPAGEHVRFHRHAPRLLQRFHPQVQIRRVAEFSFCTPSAPAPTYAFKFTGLFSAGRPCLEWPAVTRIETNSAGDFVTPARAPPRTRGGQLAEWAVFWRSFPPRGMVTRTVVP